MFIHEKLFNFGVRELLTSLWQSTTSNTEVTTLFILQLKYTSKAVYSLLYVAIPQLHNCSIFLLVKCNGNVNLLKFVNICFK